MIHPIPRNASGLCKHVIITVDVSLLCTKGFGISACEKLDSDFAYVVSLILDSVLAIVLLAV